MQIKRTTFVVGAGASAELGLPVGSALKQDIAKLADIRYEDEADEYRLSYGRKEIADTLNDMAHARTGASLDDYIAAGLAIRNNMPLAISIDNFLDAHKEKEDLVLLGKILICAAILDAEKRSALYVENYDPDVGIPFSRFENCWHLRFMQI